MNDTVTIITSVTNNQIVKSFGGGDYQPLKFSPGSEFLVYQHPVHDLQSLASIIGGLEDETTKAVIRGLPLLPENEPVARQSQNFSSTSHHWCMTDIDSLPWDTDLHDHKAILELNRPGFTGDCLVLLKRLYLARSGLHSMPPLPQLV